MNNKKVAHLRQQVKRQRTMTIMSITNYNPLVKCNDCGNTCYRDELKIFIERHGLSEPPYEHFAVCPFCGGTDIEEARDENG